jgi:hypothetical protein
MFTRNYHTIDNVREDEWIALVSLGFSLKPTEASGWVETRVIEGRNASAGAGRTKMAYQSAVNAPTS